MKGCANMKHRYQKPLVVKDLLDSQGRIVLAYGEATGHHHEVVAGETAREMPVAQFFEDPSGRRVLLALAPCVLRHQEHGPIVLEPDRTVQIRQGDVFLTPLGRGAWEVTRQREYTPEAIRNVQD